ncbi:MAG: hypothetical protein F4Y58_01180 [Gammaproteobacteria bacterium]|nr:hypothetical protein [Gammaproteobacteria bacterium]
MSDIALYNALTKLGLEPNEAKEAVADITSSQDMATKADLKAGLAELETRLVKQMYAVAGIIIAAVGLMINIF